MSDEIVAASLTKFEVTQDGARVCFHAKNHKGAPVSMSLPSECLTQMLMTLPRIALEALQKKHNDQSLRIVYPTGSWRVEQSVQSERLVIVTLGTPDGFEVSFGLEAKKLNAIQAAFKDAADFMPTDASPLN